MEGKQLCSPVFFNFNFFCFLFFLSKVLFSFCLKTNAFLPLPLAPPTGRLMRCLRCPVAYHMGEQCVAAGSEMVTSSAIVCTNHFNAKKAYSHHSHVNVSWCFVCSKGVCVSVICVCVCVSFVPFTVYVSHVQGEHA